MTGLTVCLLHTTRGLSLMEDSSLHVVLWQLHYICCFKWGLSAFFFSASYRLATAHTPSTYSIVVVLEPHRAL